MAKKLKAPKPRIEIKEAVKAMEEPQPVLLGAGSGVTGVTGSESATFSVGKMPNSIFPMRFAKEGRKSTTSRPMGRKQAMVIGWKSC